MQVSIISTFVFSLFTSFCFASTSSLIDTFPSKLKNDRILQLGVQYRSAVRLELEVPTAELLFQPSPFFSFGARVGQVHTRKLTELFKGSKGRMSGYVLRVNIPDDDKLDMYLEFASMRGSLPFEANVYGLSRSEVDDRFNEATDLSGQVAFRQNQFQFGIRQHLGRYFFVDASIGFVTEKFILEAEGVKNARSAVGYFFDFNNELPPNEWHKNIAPRFGFTMGVRI